MPAMDDKNAMAEKILCDLATAFSRDFLLEEFGIIPMETNLSNKSPVIHINHRLGLESWCVKHVYNYAYNNLMDHYISKKSSKLYRINADNCDEVNRMLMGALLINPDVVTFWNKRREMHLKKFLDFYDEMRFSKLVLSKKPKSNESFAYRKWLLERYWAETSPPSPFVRLIDVTREELNLTEYCAERSPNNYHAWTHRIWLIKELGKYSSSTAFEFLQVGELCFSERWVTSHISDHSGLHFRQFILSNAIKIEARYCLIDDSDFYKYRNCLCKFMQPVVDDIPDPNDFVNPGIKEKEAVKCVLGTLLNDSTPMMRYVVVFQNITLFIYELLLNEELSKLYTSHEALWYHRKFVLYTLLEIIHDYFGESSLKPCDLSSNSKYFKQGQGNIINQIEFSSVKDDTEETGIEAKILRHHNHSVHSCSLYKALAINEKKFIEQRSKCADVFSLKYEKWLRIVLGFNF